MDLFDLQGRRQGHVVLDERSGRFKILDRHSRRVGWGRVDGERIERFDLRGRRVSPEGRWPPDGRR